MVLKEIIVVQLVKKEIFLLQRIQQELVFQIQNIMINIYFLIMDEILDELQPGRDMVMFGKADYGQSCGSLNADGTFTSEVNEAYLKVMECCRKRNIGFMACPSAGANGQTAADVQKVIEDGCSAVVLNTDQLTLAAAFGNIVGPCLELEIKK